MTVTEAQMENAIAAAHAASERTDRWRRAAERNESEIHALEIQLDRLRKDATIIQAAVDKAEAAEAEADSAYGALAREYYAGANFL